jgi:hypothetical protein
LEKGDEGGFLKSPLTPLYERGELTPLTITSPLGGEDEGEGENTPSANQTPLYERGIDRTEKGVNQPSHIESVAEKSVR